MFLDDLCPAGAADLEQLRELLEGRGWRASMPPELPEHILLQLTRDFRQTLISLGNPNSDPDSHSVAAAMFLVLNLLMQHPRKAPGSSTLDISETHLVRAMQIYQMGLEREVVTRIVGFRPSGMHEILLDEMWRTTHS